MCEDSCDHAWQTLIRKPNGDMGRQVTFNGFQTGVMGDVLSRQAVERIVDGLRGRTVSLGEAVGVVRQAVGDGFGQEVHVGAPHDCTHICLCLRLEDTAYVFMIGYCLAEGDP